MIELTRNSKQVNVNYPSYEGEDGGYYIPSVENHELTWVASKAGMPAVESSNVQGERGESGVYIGDNPPEDVNVWVNPNEVPDLIVTMEQVEALGYITEAEVDKKFEEFEVPPPDLGGYATEDYVDDAIANVELKQGEKGEDGYTPVKGVDYFTDADKTALVNDVLAALPAAEEVSV